jgi:hypothetical protein
VRGRAEEPSQRFHNIVTAVAAFIGSVAAIMPVLLLFQPTKPVVGRCTLPNNELGKVRLIMNRCKTAREAALAINGDDLVEFADVGELRLSRSEIGELVERNDDSREAHYRVF